MRAFVSVTVVTLLILGCGGGSDPTEVVTPPTPVDNTPLPPAPATNIIAADSFDVIPAEAVDFNDPAFLVAREALGTVPAGLVAASGKVLVLSVRDLANPDLLCGGGSWSDACSSMVVLEQEGIEPGRRPGRVELSLLGGRKTWYPQADTVTLGEALPPG
jgi:hypothetical protein